MSTFTTKETTMTWPTKSRRRTALGACLTTWAAWALALSPGESAPDFQLPGLREAVQLSAQRGKLVYLDFWASWCGPCRQSFPWMNEIQGRYGSQGLQVIAVNLDASRDDARRFLAEVPAQFTVAFDSRGETPRRYAVKGMPSSVLIAPDGTVLAVHTGFRAEDRADLETQITRALARPAPTATHP
jgi:thiol-disulfide isomerase/thioredoxin